MPEASELMAAHDVGLVLAPNPGPFTLTGTNTWLLGRDPCWVVDPGPLTAEHLDAVLAAGRARGGIGAIALTHGHHDHAEALPALAERASVGTIVAARHPLATIRPSDGEVIGGLRVFAVPGHAPDHLCFATGAVCCTGDAVLGEGSVFVAPQSGGLRSYLDGLQRMRAAHLKLLLPGHGPVVADPAAKLDGYLAHRGDREQALVAALAAGLRTTDELIGAAWADAPPALRPITEMTLGAYLEMLAQEGRLPEGVEQIELPDWLGTAG